MNKQLPFLSDSAFDDDPAWNSSTSAQDESIPFLEEKVYAVIGFSDGVDGGSPGHE